MMPVEEQNGFMVCLNCENISVEEQISLRMFSKVTESGITDGSLEVYSGTETIII
jgi:hypothetical protein